MKKLLCLFLFITAISLPLLAETISGVDGNITWSLDTETGQLTLSGTGEMPNYYVTESGGYSRYGSYHPTTPWFDLSNFISDLIPLLIKSVVVEEGITNIGAWAFCDLSNLESVKLPSTLKVIGSMAFRNCRSLTEVDLPHSVERIGLDAFMECSSLQSLTIPASVVDLYDRHSLPVFPHTDSGPYVIPEKCFAFYGCSSLSSIVVEEGNPVYDSRDNCNAIIRKEDNSLLFGCRSTVIPESASKIADYAFEGSSIESIVIPCGIDSVGTRAFAGCSKLEEVIVEASYPPAVPYRSDSFSQGAGIFPTYGSLTKILLPNAFAEVYQYAWGWSEYKDLFVDSDTARGIDGNISWVLDKETGKLVISGNGPMKDELITPDWRPGGPWIYYSDFIKSVIVDDGVTSIGSYAFWYARYLSSVTLSSTVRLIGEQAFLGCLDLSNVTFAEGLESIERNAFTLCPIKNVNIPASVSKIDPFAFNSPSVRSLPDESFVVDEFLSESFEVDAENTIYDSRDACNALIETSTNTLLVGTKNATIPEGVEHIGDCAFMGVDVPAITIPSSVSSIGLGAFVGCTTLKELRVYGYSPACFDVNETLLEYYETLPYTIPDSPFMACSSLDAIYVPYGTADAYKSAAGWSEYADKIVEMAPQETCDNLLYIEDIKTFHKSQLTVPVLMKNAKPYTAFQCDITLPEGLTLHKTMNEDDEEVFDIAYGSRAKSTHSLMANQLANGNIRVAGYSSSNADYRDSEDMFFTLTVDVADDASGDLTIKLSNVILTSATDGDTECPDMQAVLTIISGQPGDVNGDGKLTMGDVVKLVNNILEVSQTGFNADLADVNEDGKVTMGDVVIVLNMILSGDYPIKAPSMRQTMAKDDGEYDVVL